ncbi:MAG: hypothetical protein LBV15_02725 [Planctomycetota bacterium]|jgi:hypothetical protein|nr:hypothetical protein [Planctomycetota bacterium]
MPDGFVVAPATAAEAEAVLADLRPEHRREIAGLTRLAPEAAVRLSLARARYVFVGREAESGEPLCLIGVDEKPLLSDSAAVWLLARERLDRRALAAAVGLRQLFGQAHRLARARRLTQLVPLWYRKGLKWLRWLGWREEGVEILPGGPHARVAHFEAREFEPASGTLRNGCPGGPGGVFPVPCGKSRADWA